MKETSTTKGFEDFKKAMKAQEKQNKGVCPHCGRCSHCDKPYDRMVPIPFTLRPFTPPWQEWITYC